MKLSPHWFSPNVFDRAKHTLSLFYVFYLFVVVNEFLGRSDILSRKNTLPSWFSFWIGGLDYATVAKIVLVGFILSAVLGTFLYRLRAGRVVVFLGVFVYHVFSIVSVSSNTWYLWSFTAFLFIFLPDVWQSEQGKERFKKFLTIFWFTQAVMLFSYTLAGITTLYGVQTPFSFSEEFSPLTGMRGFQARAADALLSEAQLPPQPFSLFTLSSPLVKALLVVFVYVKLFSFVVAFFPSLHRLWSLLLIFFHGLAVFSVGLHFLTPAALLLVLFFDSPFRKPDTRWQEVLFDLPLFGWALRLGDAGRWHSLKKD